jgi:paraquat-inducible protein A
LPASAAARALYVCSACSTLSRAGQGLQRCPRCGSALNFRKPRSLGRTWAFLVAAIILYVPANVLPVMHTEWLTGSQDDTILSGVLYLLWSGSWPLALVVFIASISVPLLKIVTLGGLAASVQLRSTWRPRSRARAYRVVEFIGRWSMLDIYVVAILAALVQAKALAHIEPGPGALAFAAVVVLTMLAAMSFDPRLIWDAERDASR